MEATPRVAPAYAPVPEWEQLPAGFTHLDCSGVGVDSAGTVFLLTRAQARVLVYDRHGSCVRSWGEELFSKKPHGLTVAPDDTIYVVDEAGHCVRHFAADGTLLRTIGTPGAAAETGYDGASLDTVAGGPPFNRPTNLAVAPSGDLYVSDGYGNCKIHRFTADGEHVASWGESGDAIGAFRLPHAVVVDEEGVVWVADRENHRIQRFTAEGEPLGQWGDVIRPTSIAFDGTGRVFVAELAQRVSILDRDGNVLARVEAGFTAPHDIAVDPDGSLYVAEVTHTFMRGAAAPGAHTFQKLAPTS